MKRRRRAPAGRRGLSLLIAVVTAGLLAWAAPASMADVVGPASQPPPPKPGMPGGPGRCTVTVRSIDNPRFAEGQTPMPVWIYEPSGTAAATIGGRRCDSAKRPAVFIGHGFGATDPAQYQDLIDHLVSTGNVVVYATYTANDGERSTMEESYRVVDSGIVEAVAQTPRIDTTRVGWWGHSHGGGMVAWLVQQGAARRWGGTGTWMMNVAQAYSQLVGADDITVPRHAQAITVAFEHDEFADNRLGIDVFESLTLPSTQKRHVTIQTDVHGQPAMVANHGAPFANGDADAVDFLLWRYADLLETCALTGRSCNADLSKAGRWSDSTPVVRPLVSPHPVDSGVVPAVLAECDAVYGPTLNPRIERCGATHI